MTLNLIKLSVGSQSVETLRDWQVARIVSSGRTRPWHITRMVPRRLDELLDGGSIYWVIAGQVRCRQRIAAIEPFEDDEGIRRCRLSFEPTLVETYWVPKRPFQGWRYLRGDEAPPDLPDGADPAGAALAEELQRLGLI